MLRVLTVEQDDRTEEILRCLHRREAALAPGAARVAPG
jgi:hypothetical protein